METRRECTSFFRPAHTSCRHTPRSAGDGNRCAQSTGIPLRGCLPQPRRSGAAPSCRWVKCEVAEGVTSHCADVRAGQRRRLDNDGMVFPRLEPKTSFDEWAYSFRCYARISKKWASGVMKYFADEKVWHWGVPVEIGGHILRGGGRRDLCRACSTPGELHGWRRPFTGQQAFGGGSRCGGG